VLWRSKAVVVTILRMLLHSSASGGGVEHVRALRVPGDGPLCQRAEASPVNKYAVRGEQVRRGPGFVLAFR